MTDPELQRSVRRSAAVLLVPLSLLLVQVEVVTSHLPGVVESPLPGLSRGVGVVLLLVSLLYLVVSGARQLYGAADTPF
ncbi:hypothetical protein [Halobellus litoreus]|jgi:hypothetical protein|uniref:Uncharacterized protein n=1 Tax=Halobellus litoreus TaxID=755310 RepID=A0ABD6DSL6_9EURY|nr:hypothetical protein [Halobellus litoreus]